MGRIVALDVGTKTIGVAVTDALRMMAHPVCTLARQGVRRDTERIVELIREREVDHVVVGLPLELDGAEERPARLARQIGAAVGEATGLPISYVDERFTSVEAERRLIDARVSRARRKEIIDQAAAIVILEAYLRGGPDAA